ncbi:MAG: ATP synthase F1 subunit epsilon [Gemmatimonadetes bacterium]|nr:ATP synthase F1 subunit epsilon [Gemmatimonadota bacterium]
MRVSVVSPEQVLFEGDASSVVAPAYDGQVGILPRHAPFMALLGEGTLAIRTGDEESRFGVSGGFIQVVDNVVRVVAERAQPAAV